MRQLNVFEEKALSLKTTIIYYFSERDFCSSPSFGCIYQKKRCAPIMLILKRKLYQTGPEVKEKQRYLTLGHVIIT